MKNEYKVTRHILNTTEEEKEEIYQELANIFTRMAQKDGEDQWKKWIKLKGEIQMKKFKWNKAKFAINILKLESITALALVYSAMFLYAMFR